MEVLGSSVATGAAWTQREEVGSASAADEEGATLRESDRLASERRPCDSNTHHSADDETEAVAEGET